MTKKVNAITVSLNYIDRKKYSIKFLAIGRRKAGHPYWFVRHVGETGFDKIVLEGKAFKMCFDNRIPFFSDVRHGQALTKEHIEQLKKYGVTV